MRAYLSNRLFSGGCFSCSPSKSICVQPRPFLFFSLSVSSFAVALPCFTPRLYSCSARSTSCSVRIPNSQHAKHPHRLRVPVFHFLFQKRRVCISCHPVAAFQQPLHLLCRLLLLLLLLSLLLLALVCCASCCACCSFLGSCAVVRSQQIFVFKTCHSTFNSTVQIVFVGSVVKVLQATFDAKNSKMSGLIKFRDRYSVRATARSCIKLHASIHVHKQAAFDHLAHFNKKWCFQRLHTRFDQFRLHEP